MSHHRVLDRLPSQQADHLSANTFPPLHQPRGHVQQRIVYPHDDQQDIHLEELEVPQPLGNAAVQDEIQYPPPHRRTELQIRCTITLPNHLCDIHWCGIEHRLTMTTFAQHPEDPYVRMHQEGIAQGVPVQAHAFAPAAQENLDGLYGYGAHFHNVWPDPAPLANMLPVNDLRNLIGRNLNNPDTLINMVWIEPGPGGRVKLWIALELADIF
ncbi:hypothetical protein EDB86DRAFT_3012205 [Lactarius hatsudake]|nr:hypothetical protein EDB86DRAFT_3012205 [Lactarius hatsudake]